MDFSNLGNSDERGLLRKGLFECLVDEIYLANSGVPDVSLTVEPTFGVKLSCKCDPMSSTEVEKKVNGVFGRLRVNVD